MSGPRPRAWVSWSTGKDSALALHTVLRSGHVQATGLLSTVSTVFDRVSMYGVRHCLLEARASALGLPLHVVELPWPCPNDVYEQQMAVAIRTALEAGVEHVVFGDLFLRDVREYRERRLTGTGISPLFPLWGRPTRTLARRMDEVGIRAVITCVDPRQAPAAIADRWYDDGLFAELPRTVDPCGERGEFHTFVVQAPGFAHPVDVDVGETLGARRLRLHRPASGRIGNRGDQVRAGRRHTGSRMRVCSAREPTVERGSGHCRYL